MEFVDDLVCALRLDAEFQHYKQPVATNNHPDTKVMDCTKWMIQEWLAYPNDVTVDPAR
jgi:hypothetical protein